MPDVTISAHSNKIEMSLPLCISLTPISTSVLRPPKLNKGCFGIIDQNPVQVKEGGVYPRFNFNSLPWALITVFTIIVYDDWNYILYIHVKGSNQPEWLSYTYILTVVILGNFLFLQLLICILIDSFYKQRKEQTFIKKKLQKDNKFSSLKVSLRSSMKKDYSPLVSDEDDQVPVLWHLM